MKKVYNILIVGIGGQGVNTLSTIIQKLLLESGQFCKGSIFKGGAQKRGTIYSTIRIFENEAFGNHLSSRIPHGELDLLFALEATECLRYAQYYHQNTKMIINDFEVPFYNERFNNDKQRIDIRANLKNNFTNSILLNLNALSNELFNNDNMVNLLIGLEAIKRNLLSIDAIKYIELFSEKIKIDYEHMLALMEYYEID